MDKQNRDQVGSRNWAKVQRSLTTASECLESSHDEI